MTASRLHGLVAMFDSAEGVLTAAREARTAGFSQLDAYTPFPVEGLAETLGLSGEGMRWWVLAGGVFGAVAGYGIQYWTAVVDYPLNIGGKPVHAWPAFLVVSFEMAVLFGALLGVVGLLVGTGLPRLHHPVFEADCFQLASRDRFFLLVEADDPRFDVSDTADFLRGLGPLDVSEVAR